MSANEKLAVGFAIWGVFSALLLVSVAFFTKHEED
jgi:hypothetical protein